MIHSSLGPLNEKFRQLCQVEEKKEVKEASGRQFYFLKEHHKLAPKVLQNVPSVAWESGKPTQQGKTHTEPGVCTGPFGCLPMAYAHLWYTHTHMHAYPEECSFFQPQSCLLTDSQKRH